ncbi:hypothetical protein K435DRAFT_772432, partial [Dendrothele bispora CBS 962.96]
MIPPLPADVLISIIEQLPASRDFEGEISAQTLARCARVNTTFRNIISTPSLWETHHKVRYIYNDERAELQRQTQFGDNWRLRYSARRTIDRNCLVLLDKVIEKRQGRCDHATAIATNCLDAWDVLDIEAGKYKRPLVFCNVNEQPDLSLTKEFWATALNKAILRTYAVRLWGSLNLEGSDAVSFVDAMSATSCFLGRGPKETSSLLNALTIQCKEYLQAKKYPTNPDDPNYSLIDLCTQICEFLRSQDFGAVEAPNFHDMMNLFPHTYLTTHRRTIPLPLVHVFVSVARDLGIAASPVDFPTRVLAHISSPDPTMDDFYVDVFGSNEKAILSLREDIPVLLARQDFQLRSVEDYISPCLAPPMLLRTGRNLLASLHTTVRVPNSLSRDSILLAFSLHVLFTRRQPLISQMFSQVDALDAATFISEALIPGVDQYPIQHGLSVACQGIMEQETREAAVTHLRSEEETSIQHFVGMVFQHKKYSYIGCIYGWDPICLASDEWKSAMGIRNLTRGEEQPFYTCFCMDGSMRYVAEENIQPPFTCNREIFSRLTEVVDYLPKYFTGVIMNETWAGHPKGRFALSPEVQLSYPEDDAIGQAWLELPPAMSQV